MGWSGENKSKGTQQPWVGLGRSSRLAGGQGDRPGVWGGWGGRRSGSPGARLPHSQRRLGWTSSNSTSSVWPLLQSHCPSWTEVKLVWKGFPFPQFLWLCIDRWLLSIISLQTGKLSWSIHFMGRTIVFLFFFLTQETMYLPLQPAKTSLSYHSLKKGCDLIPWAVP